MSSVFQPTLSRERRRDLPHHAPDRFTDPFPDPFDVHALSIPAGTFTGDFFFIERQPTELWLALGDIAGKGLHAAVFMAMVQEELEKRISSCSLTGCDPASTMTRLHDVLRPLFPYNRFATAVIARVATDGTMQIANAGHCPPLILRADGTIEEIGSTGPPVGILPVARWCSTRTRLGKGDTLLLYSDGLIESQSESCQEFTLGKVRDLLTNRPHPSARALTQYLRDAVHEHSLGKRDDDLTLLAVKRR